MNRPINKPHIWRYDATTDILPWVARRAELDGIEEEPQAFATWQAALAYALSEPAHILWEQDEPDEFPDLTDLTPEQAADATRYAYCPDCTWSAALDIPGEVNARYYHPIEVKHAHDAIPHYECVHCANGTCTALEDESDDE